MRKSVITSLLQAALILCAAFSNSYAQNYPRPSSPARLVNDFAEILSPSEESQLENKLVAYDDSTSIEITIVTIESLDGDEIAQYSFGLGDAWGIGREQKDNGVLIVVAEQDREVFIATGRGMEGALPDAICKRIIENEIIPEFKNGDYYSGLNEGINAIIKNAKGEYVNDEEDDEPRENWWWVLLIFGVVIFFIWIGSKFMGNGGYISGDGSRSTHWGGGWVSGGFGGGSSGSSGSGGGGFGGFGGGSFGGGGAGGKW